MIRPFCEADLPEVLEIWLQGNLDAHSFISPDYWRENQALAARLIPQATVYVSERNGTPEGFLGLTGGTVAGLFVRRDARSAGVGSALLKIAQDLGRTLELCVYEKNTGALRFYRRHSFIPKLRRTDPFTGETELVMVWTP